MNTQLVNVPLLAKAPDSYRDEFPGTLPGGFGTGTAPGLYLLTTGVEDGMVVWDGYTMCSDVIENTRA